MVGTIHHYAIWSALHSKKRYDHHRHFIDEESAAYRKLGNLKNVAEPELQSKKPSQI